MNRIAEICNFYSLSKIKEYIDNGGKYPLHHIWCYDKLIENGYETVDINYNDQSFLNKIGKRIKIANFQQQINYAFRSKEYDIIFAPVASDILFISFLKYLKLFNKPVIAICHKSYSLKYKSHLKNIKNSIERFFLFRGADRVLFLNENIYHEWGKCKSYKNVTYLKHWGIDIHFFNNYLQSIKTAGSADYILTTGFTDRNFNILIDSFIGINFKLLIVTKYNYLFRSNYRKNLNIEVNTSINPGYTSVTQMLPLYYNAYAVAIPINQKLDLPSGITVIFEAMAMGKPVITSENKFFPIDIEKEKVGLVVKDENGWSSAIQYLIDHPNEAKEMGERGRKLCKEKYNYDLFCKELLSHISTL
jgi:glycosyltransferase involved in cell wall biosynthesis